MIRQSLVAFDDTVREAKRQPEPFQLQNALQVEKGSSLASPHLTLGENPRP